MLPFHITAEAVLDKVLPELKQYKFQLLQSSLSQENEAKRREALGSAQ
jgi:uncharacterized membrane protein